MGKPIISTHFSKKNTFISFTFNILSFYFLYWACVAKLEVGATSVALWEVCHVWQSKHPSWARPSPSVSVVALWDNVFKPCPMAAGKRSENIWEKQFCWYQGQWRSRRRRCSRHWSTDSPADPVGPHTEQVDAPQGSCNCTEDPCESTPERLHHVEGTKTGGVCEELGSTEGLTLIISYVLWKAFSGVNKCIHCKES